MSNGGVSGGEPVILNIYDMFWTNDYTGGAGLGVYHSGVEGRGNYLRLIFTGWPITSWTWVLLTLISMFHSSCPSALPIRQTV